MVNKKGTKRKTRWRTLSIGDGGTGAAADTDVTMTGTTSDSSTNQPYEGRIKHSTTSSGLTYPKVHSSGGFKHITDPKAQSPQVPSATQPSTRYNNHYESNRNNYYSRSSDKFPPTSHYQQSGVTNGYHGSSSSTNTTNVPYKRRPFSSQSSGYASRHYNTGSNSSSTTSNYHPPHSHHHHHNRSSAGDSVAFSRSTWKSNRSVDSCENKENSTTKPLFNEDDYTRITTPRQDVLFKKGYLSRPKRTTTSTTATAGDLNTSSSSGTVSVVSSTEESMSSSMQSFGPDADPFDPLMYPAFYDQNGVFFINPYVSNGFDPYGGQLMVMPYGGGPPYSINPAEYYNTDAQPYPCDEPGRTESPSMETQTVISTTENSTNATEEMANDDNVDVSETIEETLEPNAEQPMAVNDKVQTTSSDLSSQDEGIDVTKTSSIESSTVTTPASIEDNLGDTAQMCPTYYYPYMFGPPPIMPFNLMDPSERSDNGYFGSSYENYSKQMRFKKRKRRPYRNGNSTGVSATTTDYSEEDDESINDNERFHFDGAPTLNGISFFPGLSVAQYNDLMYHTNLNTNVSEFVPSCSVHPTLPDDEHAAHPTNTIVVDEPTSAPKSTLNVDVAEFLPRNYIKPTLEMPEPFTTTTTTDAAAIVDLPQAKPKSSHRFRNIPTIVHVPMTTTTPAFNRPSYSSISANRDKSSTANAAVIPAKIERILVKSDLESKIVVASPKTIVSVDRAQKKANGRPPNTNRVSNKSVAKGNARYSSKPTTVQSTVEAKPPLATGVAAVKRSETPKLPTYAEIITPIVVTKIAVDSPKIKLANGSTLQVDNAVAEVVVQPKQSGQTWHTVTSKGKKKLQVVELSADFWDEIDEPEMVAPVVTPTPIDLKTVPIAETVAVNDAVPKVIVKLPKKPKKLKAKKSVIIALSTTDSDDAKLLVEETLSLANHEIDNVAKVVPATTESTTPTNTFEFENDPAIFVNAITPSAIYTEPAVDKTVLNSNFSLTGSMNFGSCKFDFGSNGKRLSPRLLREEEEMVMRAMRSLSLPKCVPDVIESVAEELIEFEQETKLEAIDADAHVTPAKSEDRCDNVRLETKQNIEKSVRKETVDAIEPNVGDGIPVLWDAGQLENVTSELNGNGSNEDIIVDDLQSLKSQNVVDEITDLEESEELSEIIDDDECVKTEQVNRSKTGHSDTESVPEERTSFSLERYDNDDDVDDDDDDDSSTVVTQLNEYIEDVMVDAHFDTSIDEDDDDDDMIIDTVTDGDIEELIKQATKIVQLNNGCSSAWATIAAANGTIGSTSHGDDKDSDRIESPRSSEDSGILDNHEDVMNSSSEYDSGDGSTAPESLTPPISTINSLTQTVSRWLVQKQKEKSVEPILRLPGDPILSDSIEKSIQRIQISAMLKSYADDMDDDDDDDNDDYDDESVESDVETEVVAKNSKSNPSLALSAENCDRVADVKSETIIIDAVDQPDILEYWENDPMLQPPKCGGGLKTKRTIDYAQLLDSVGPKTTDDLLLLNQMPATNTDKTTTSTMVSNTPNNCSSNLQQQQLHHNSNRATGQSPTFGFFKQPQMGCAIM